MKDADGEKNNAEACMIEQKEDKKKREHLSPFPSWVDGECMYACVRELVRACGRTWIQEEREERE